MSNIFSNALEGNTYIGYKSRIIASWIKVGGGFRSNREKKEFKEWLSTLVERNYITSDQRWEVLFMIDNGKLELQEDARKFFREHSR